MVPVNMKDVPGLAKIILAENQPQYVPLPALRDHEKFLTEWELTPEERQHIAEGGRVRLYVWGQFFQPIHLSVTPKADVLPVEPLH